MTQLEGRYLFQYKGCFPNYRIWYGTITLVISEFDLMFDYDFYTNYMQQANKGVWRSKKVRDCRLTLDNFDSKVKRVPDSEGVTYWNGEISVLIFWDEYEQFKDRCAFIKWIIPFLNGNATSKFKKVVVRDIRCLAQKT